MAEVRRRIASALGLTAGSAVLAFGVGAPPEHCPAVTADEVSTAARAAAAWLIGNQQEDGTWLYEYDRDRDVALEGYNVVRHAGVMTSLYQAATAGIAGASASADSGLAWAIERLVERHGWAALPDGSTVSTGTNALLVAALAERRLLTGDDRYDEVLERLAGFIERQVEPTGAVLAYYDLDADRARPATYSIYYTGEAYWALARMHHIQPEAGWGALADRVGAYIATERDVAEDIWPPLADHWAGYGIAETARFPERPAARPLTDDELALARRQGGLIGQRVRSISERFGPWGPVVRGTFTPRGGGYGVFGEGLTGLWRASQLDERLAPERGDLAARIECIAGLAIRAQSDAADAAAYPEPDMVEGAWFIDDVTRMDDQQHALSALLLTLPVIEAGTTGSGHPAPSPWLWLVVVVAVVQPISAGLAVPRRAARGERARIAALGGAIAATATLVVGALSGPILAALDVSRPAMRLAAGGLCILATAVDLVRGPRGPATIDPTGRGAALVPVAIPLVLRPALPVVALSVVADHGLVFLAGSLLLTVAGVVAAAVLGREGVVATWAAWTVSAFGMATAVLLVADAVFAI